MMVLSFDKTTSYYYIMTHDEFVIARIFRVPTPRDVILKMYESTSRELKPFLHWSSRIFNYTPVLQKQNCHIIIIWWSYIMTHEWHIYKCEWKVGNSWWVTYESKSEPSTISLYVGLFDERQSPSRAVIHNRSFFFSKLSWPIQSISNRGTHSTSKAANVSKLVKPLPESWKRN